MSDYQLKLRKLHRRDWVLWWTSVTVMLLLALAIVSLSLPALIRDTGTFFQFNLDQAVRGLVGAVLLFNTYAIYQQIIVKRLHRRLADQIEETTRLEAHAEALHKLAMLDSLTGLHNRRYAEERLEAEVALSHRSGRPLTVMLLDLDDFKKVNDRYGHPVGDLVLKEFAGRLKTLVRISDLAVRLGGDEFLLLLVDCAPEMAEKLIGRVSQIGVTYKGKTIPVGFCSGWSGCQPGDTAQTLLERADQALYNAKRKTKTPAAEVTA